MDLFSAFRKKELSWDPNIELGFKNICQKVKKLTMTSDERLYALYQATRYIIHSNIEGDFVECGVWKGGSCMMMAYALMEMGITDRKIYLYDTFNGMTNPTDYDRETLSKKSAFELLKKSSRDQCDSVHAKTDMDSVVNHMLSTGYPKENIIFIAGKVEDTLKTHPHKAIALLRLDTDWYESTLLELERLYPLLTSKGILIIDDYGYWAGTKKAVDEYFSKTKQVVLMNRIDFTGRLIHKI